MYLVVLGSISLTQKQKWVQPPIEEPLTVDGESVPDLSKKSVWEPWWQEVVAIVDTSWDVLLLT